MDQMREKKGLLLSTLAEQWVKESDMANLVSRQQQQLEMTYFQVLTHKTISLAAFRSE